MKKALYTFLLWAVVFLVSYGALSATGLVPLEISEVNSTLVDIVTLNVFRFSTSSAAAVSNDNSLNATSSLRFHESLLPERIVIEKININMPIENPPTRDIAVLDQALLSGVVRYPGSGGLDDQSNMFLFGHSTSFRTVHNVAFQAFNRLGELQIGDTIKVMAGDSEYRYKVISVSQVNKDKALVEFSSGEKLLTLSTCDTFGERSDRFIVTARFIQTVPIQGQTR
ncbi:MAG TPA: sortase [Candidatus Paceibacterota bacterium]